MIDPATTWIDVDVAVGRDTVIAPGSQLLQAGHLLLRLLNGAGLLLCLLGALCQLGLAVGQGRLQPCKGDSGCAEASARGEVLAEPQRCTLH